MTDPGVTNASAVGTAPVPDEGGGPVAVFVTVAVRTSAGAGPGVRRVPAAEAGRLVAMKYACHGEAPPRGWPG